MNSIMELMLGAFDSSYNIDICAYIVTFGEYYV